MSVKLWSNTLTPYISITISIQGGVATFITEHEVKKVYSLNLEEKRYESPVKSQDQINEWQGLWENQSEFLPTSSPRSSQHIRLSADSCYLSDVFNIKFDVKGKFDVMLR